MEQDYNPWHSKPWWCQPWSILLTGTTLITGAGLLTRTPWMTLIVALPVLAWMGLFLILWPKAMKEIYAEAQLPKDAESGVDKDLFPHKLDIDS